MRDRILLSAIALIVLMGVGHTQAKDRGVIKENLEINYGQLQDELFIEDLFTSNDNQPESEKIRIVNAKGETLEEIIINRGELLKASTSQSPILRKGEFLMEIHGVSYFMVND